MTKTLGKEWSFAEGPSNSLGKDFFEKILKDFLPRAKPLATDLRFALSEVGLYNM
jgi:hypothetical protein